MITAHVMVKNEFNFIWYSVLSVVKHVDRVMLWDTGSTDGTLEIIEKIKTIPEAMGKVIVRTLKLSNFNEESVRQEMLNETPKGWFIVVDGDEIWWDESMRKVVKVINDEGSRLESIVVPTVNTVGDIFHYQEKEAGNYNLAGKLGHYNLRAINTQIEGLHSLGTHGVWGWADIDKKQIQDRDQKRIKYIDAPYLHCTFLERSTSRSFDKQVAKRKMKLKYEIGLSFPLDFYYPEVLFENRPGIVPSVWAKMSTRFFVRALFETPLRKLKRRVFPRKVGY